MVISPFRSFWQAGYECADHLNRTGERVDFLAITGHAERVAEDYTALLPFGITTVREGIHWSQVERQPRVYDWREVVRRIETARHYEIQQIWDICHFGFPVDLIPTHPRFVERFAAVCKAFARLWRTLTDAPLIFTPVNEISYLSWYGGEAGGTLPYGRGQSYDIKANLVRAALAGIEAVWEIDAQARVLHTEPLIHIVPPADRPDLTGEASEASNGQFQALDMLGGYTAPELGGNPRYLDLLGFNFYYNNQWVYEQDRLQWEAPRDPRWIPLAQLLTNAYRRYNRPICLSETSHLGQGRGDWIMYVANEVRDAIDLGVDVHGVCLYPIIDRPNWDRLGQYHHSGLWDLALRGPDPLARVLSEPYAVALRAAQDLLQSYTPQAQSVEMLV